MIYSGKNTSVKVIIAKLYRDLDLKEDDVFIDFLEWSAEALEKIGAFTQLETKIKDVNIHNYRGELCEDLVYINSVSFNGYPILPSTSPLGPIKIDLKGSPSDAPYAFYEDKIQNKVFVNPADSGLYTLNNRGLYERVTYQINNGCIKTSFHDGCLKISYQAMPIDDDGFPLVPDYVEFREALYWYINMKYSYSLWRRGELRDGIYVHAQEQWHWYCQQAANKAMIPDLNTLESIKRSFLCLRPRTEQFRNFFNDLNKTNNHSSYYDSYL